MSERVEQSLATSAAAVEPPGAMEPKQESLLSRCEIPIIDLAHIGKHSYPDSNEETNRPRSLSQRSRTGKIERLIQVSIGATEHAQSCKTRDVCLPETSLLL